YLLLFACLFSGAVHAEQIVGTVVSIADGDTLTVLDQSKRQHKIRLDGIDAPERKQPFGTRSRQSLAELCFQKSATVEAKGRDRYGRTIGIIRCAGVDANREQIRRGMAWVFDRYVPGESPLYRIQAEAREAKRGLWVDAEPIAPWEWRAVRRAMRER